MPSVVGQSIAVAVRVAAAAVVLAAAGCLVVTDKTVDASGVRISRATLDQIEPGTTSEAWVVATLGEPVSRTVVREDPHTAVLRYEYTVSTSKESAVFLLFAGDSQERSTTTTFFEVVDGVVTRWWTEG